MTLHELYLKYKNSGTSKWECDKATVHTYIEVYEEILNPYRYKAQNILEIGLMSGESLRMWTEYFSGNVYGMDCSETPINGLADLRPIIAEGKHNIIIGDATSEADIEKNFIGKKFDVVIDDGSHQLTHQLKSFNLLKDRMRKGGLYIIEDCADIELNKDIYLALHDNVEILDRRSIKNRFDDVIVLIKF
jgi:SAM-dependent methyltransferase